MTIPSAKMLHRLQVPRLLTLPDRVLVLIFREVAHFSSLRALLDAFPSLSRLMRILVDDDSIIGERIMGTVVAEDVMAYCPFPLVKDRFLIFGLNEKFHQVRGRMPHCMVEPLLYPFTKHIVPLSHVVYVPLPYKERGEAVAGVCIGPQHHLILGWALKKGASTEVIYENTDLFGLNKRTEENLEPSLIGLNVLDELTEVPHCKLIDIHFINSVHRPIISNVDFTHTRVLNITYPGLLFPAFKNVTLTPQSHIPHRQLVLINRRDETISYTPAHMPPLSDIELIMKFDSIELHNIDTYVASQLPLFHATSLVWKAPRNSPGGRLRTPLLVSLKYFKYEGCLTTAQTKFVLPALEQLEFDVFVNSESALDAFFTFGARRIKKISGMVRSLNGKVAKMYPEMFERIDRVRELMIQGDIDITCLSKPTHFPNLTYCSLSVNPRSFQRLCNAKNWNHGDLMLFSNAPRLYGLKLDAYGYKMARNMTLHITTNSPTFADPESKQRTPIPPLLSVDRRIRAIFLNNEELCSTRREKKMLYKHWYDSELYTGFERAWSGDLRRGFTKVKRG